MDKFKDRWPKNTMKIYKGTEIVGAHDCKRPEEEEKVNGRQYFHRWKIDVKWQWYSFSEQYWEYNGQKM